MLKIEVDSSFVISRTVQRKHDDLLAFYVCAHDEHMRRKTNVKEVYKDLMVLDLKLYCLKEICDDYKKKRQIRGENTSLRSSFHQPGEYDEN